MAKDTVARYIRLNNLIPELLEIVDDGKIAFIPAVTLSFISEEVQYEIVEVFEEDNYSINMKKASNLRQYHDAKKLDRKIIKEILSGALNKVEKIKSNTIKVKANIVSRYFKPEHTQAEIEGIIEKALEMYFTSELGVQ